MTATRLAGHAAKIIRHYKRFHGGGPDGADLPYRLTASGAWAASLPAHLFYFFRKLRLGEGRLFIDLGSGDGVVACIAGLFIRTIGIEADTELALQAGRSARNLGLSGNVGFVCADFLTQRIREADYLYIYPDKPIDALEPLLQGWKGALLVYGPHFPPKRLIQADKLKCGRESLAIYRSRL